MKDKKFDLGNVRKSKEETNSSSKLNVLQKSSESRLEKFRINFNNALIEYCKTLKADNPTAWKYQVTKIAEEELGMTLQYSQFKPFEKGLGRNINFYIAIFVTILEKSQDGKLTIVIDKDNITINGIKG